MLIDSAIFNTLFSMLIMEIVMEKECEFNLEIITDT